MNNGGDEKHLFEKKLTVILSSLFIPHAGI